MYGPNANGFIHHKFEISALNEEHARAIQAGLNLMIDEIAKTMCVYIRTEPTLISRNNFETGKMAYLVFARYAIKEADKKDKPGKYKIDMAYGEIGVGGFGLPSIKPSEAP